MEASAGEVSFATFPWPPADTGLLQAQVPAAELGDVAAWRRAFRRASLRWHPDKVGARLGARIAAADRERVMERVTAVNLALTAERDAAMAQLAAA